MDNGVHFILEKRLGNIKSSNSEIGVWALLKPKRCEQWRALDFFGVKGVDQFILKICIEIISALTGTTRCKPNQCGVGSASAKSFNEKDKMIVKTMKNYSNL